MTQLTQPNTDIIDRDFLEAATTREGPWVTIYLPTQRTGREVLAGRSQLNNLLRLAEQKLRDDGYERPDELLAEVRSITEPQAFWQTQSDGLAVFIAPGFTQTFRLPVDLPDEVSVGDCPRLHPIAPLLSGSGLFYLLALSNRSVRLFEMTRTSIGELDLGDTPRSLDDLNLDFDPQQRHLAALSKTGGVGVHGHGGDDRIAEQNTEQLFRAVAEGVDKVLNSTSPGPIVLASVAEHHSTFRSVTNREVLDDIVAGNPDNKSAQELYQEARPIAKARVVERTEALLEQLGAHLGTGKASDQQHRVAEAATEGRVDTLILGLPPTRPDGQADLVEDPVDAIIVDVLRNSGRIVVIEDEDAPQVRAIFRY